MLIWLRFWPLQVSFAEGDLPPDSPNLNSIERLWKVMNEEARNNVCFNTAKEFKTKIRCFFDERLPKISENLRTRINDNFHVHMPQTDS